MMSHRFAILCLSLLTSVPGLAQTPRADSPTPQLPQVPAPAVVRVRGIIESVAARSVRIKTRSGESVELALSDKLALSEVYPIALSDIQAGSFIGTAALPQVDGSQRAIAVTLFPESARGTAEGFRPFDLQPDSTMTNATVADVVSEPADRMLRVKYKGGEKIIVVTPDTPVVSFKPGDRSLLVPGASVSTSVQVLDGKPTAIRINAGRAGFALPY